jgi:hypothetical protein
VEYGGGSGYLLELVDGESWCRCWMLVADSTELHINYTCPRAVAGLDDAIINEMLFTLRIDSRAG